MRLRSAFSLTLLLAPQCAIAEPDSRTAPLAEEHPRYLNTQVSIDERIADLISRLTLEQKAALLNHKGTTVTVDSRPILSDQWNQCLNGVSWDRPTTLFPTCIAMAATWNTDLVQNEIARVLSDEARAIYNLKRLDPRRPASGRVSSIARPSSMWSAIRIGDETSRLGARIPFSPAVWPSPTCGAYRVTILAT